MEYIARSFLAAALSRAFADPHPAEPGEAGPVQDSARLTQAWILAASRSVNIQQHELGVNEMDPATAGVDDLAAWLTLPREERVRAHQVAFGLLISPHGPPYETEYCHWNDATYRSNQLADIAGFYRAFGLEPGEQSRNRQDHIAHELEFIAFLNQKLAWALERQGEREHVEICLDALRKFLQAHAAWWMPTFGRCLEERAGQLAASSTEAPHAEALSALAGSGRFLRAWLVAERIWTGVAPSQELIAPQVEDAPTAMQCGPCPIVRTTTFPVPG